MSVQAAREFVKKLKQDAVAKHDPSYNTIVFGHHDNEVLIRSPVNLVDYHVWAYQLAKSIAEKNNAIFNHVFRVEGGLDSKQARELDIRHLANVLHFSFFKRR